jgi:O-6-methylguanine DNA methyltransferase
MSNIVNKLFITTIHTKFGEMSAIADNSNLHFLKFSDSSTLANDIELLKLSIWHSVVKSKNFVLELLEKELFSYFQGTLRNFTVPVRIVGTEFQKLALNELIKIQFGQTLTYSELANKISKAGAYRAVANANGKNKILIVIPCHRVIRLSGELGGYNCGVNYKKLLLEHEKQISHNDNYTY